MPFSDKFWIEQFKKAGVLPAEREGVITETLQAAGNTALQVGKGIGSTVEETTGDPSMRQFFQEKEAANPQWRPDQNYSPSSLHPADIARTVSTGVTQSAMSLGAGVVGGAIGGAPGAAVAMTAGMMSQTYGERVKEYREAMPGADDGVIKGWAFLSSLGESLIETVAGPEQMVAGAFKGIVKQALNQTTRQLIKMIGKEAAKSAIAEGSEEVCQMYWDNVVRMAAGQNVELQPFSEVRDTFMGGALPGAVMGGAGAGVSQAMRNKYGQANDYPTAIDPAAAATGQQTPGQGEQMDPALQVVQGLSEQLKVPIRFMSEAEVQQNSRTDAEGNPVTVNGFYDTAKSEIVLNPNGELSVEQAFGHELKHFLNVNHPDLVETFDSMAQQNLTEKGKQELADTGALYGQAGNATEEFNADWFSRLAMDPDALREAAILAEGRSAGFGKKLIDAVTEFLKMVMDTAKRIGTPEMEAIFNNARDVRAEAIRALSDFNQRQNSQMVPVEQAPGEVKQLAGRPERKLLAAGKPPQERTAEEQARQKKLLEAAQYRSDLEQRIKERQEREKVYKETLRHETAMRKIDKHLADFNKFGSEAMDDEAFRRANTEELDRIEYAIRKGNPQLVREGLDRLAKRVKGWKRKGKPVSVSTKTEIESGSKPVVEPKKLPFVAPGAPAPTTQDVVTTTPNVVPAKKLPFVAPQAEPVETPVEAASTQVEASPGGVVRVNTNEIHVDPKRFQFKSGTNPVTGVDESNKVGGEWDPKSAGLVYVWEDKEGKKFIVNGHHRLQLAKELNVPVLNAIVDREVDGVSQEEARRQGVLTNIRDGQGRVEDYATFVRGDKSMDEAAARKEGITSRSAGQQGFMIGRYAGEELYAAFKAGDITGAKAAAIADAGKDDPATQIAGMKKAKEMSAEQLREFLKILKRQQREQKLDQLDLFGFDDSAIKMSEDVSKLAIKKLKEIRDRVLTVQRAVRKPDVAQQGDVQVGGNAHKLYEEALQEQARWEHYETDHELYQQLMDEAGYGKKEDTPASAPAPVAQAEGAQAPAKVKPINPDNPLGLDVFDDMFNLFSESAKDKQKADQAKAKSEAKAAEINRLNLIAKTPALDLEKKQEPQPEKQPEQEKKEVELTEALIRNSGMDKGEIERAVDFLQGNRNFVNEIAYQRVKNQIQKGNDNVRGVAGDMETNPGVAGEASPVDVAGGGVDDGRGSGRPGVRNPGEATGEGQKDGGGQGPSRESGPAGDDVSRAGAGAGGYRGVQATSPDVGRGDSGGVDAGRGGHDGRNGTPDGGRSSNPSSGKPGNARIAGKTVAERIDQAKAEQAKAVEKLKAALGKFNTGGRNKLNLSIIGLSDDQINALGEILVASAHYGYALAAEGFYRLEDWAFKVKERLGGLFTENGIPESELDELIRQIWDSKHTLETGEAKRVSEWAEKFWYESVSRGDKANELQRQAESIPVKQLDFQNIVETLPKLLPEQQEDVYKTEVQFFDPSHNTREYAYGKGMLFTNGTGTGKTYTGLGIAKRFIRQGKDRILVVTPSQEKVKDWIDDARNLLIPLQRLDGTKDKGQGPVVTTFANFRANQKLAEDVFDLVIYDESHRIMENKGGEASATTGKHHMMANRDPQAALRRMKLVHPLWIEYNKVLNDNNDLRKTYRINEPEGNSLKDLVRANNHIPFADLEKLHKVLSRLAQLDWEQKKILPDMEKKAEEAAKKTKVVFLSATPFNTIENLQYAVDYTFVLPEAEQRGYSNVSPFDKFRLENFGARYRWRYHRVEEHTENPEAAALQEVMFADKLLAAGVHSTRLLNSEFDYSREFPLVTGAYAPLFNKGLASVMDFGVDGAENQYSPLRKAFGDVFYDYNYATALFETLKTAQTIPYIEQLLEQGKKVVIFHRRIQGNVEPPFAKALQGARLEARLVLGNQNSGEQEKNRALATLAAADSFEEEYASLLEYEQTLDYRQPIQQVKNIFGERAVAFNGNSEYAKEKKTAVKKFNDDNSGVDVFMVQEDAGKEGISLHDTTGKHPRVLINMALPNSPITFLQAEGRTYRIGNQSNARFVYPMLGLDLEIFHFGSKVNKRVSTTENLSMGSQGRDMLLSIANGVLYESGEFDINGDGVGGKERDRRQAGTQATLFDRAVAQYYNIEKNNKKRDNREGNDYYATPEPLGYMMGKWGGVKDGDAVLEPSAGHGALVGFLPSGVKLTAIEPSMSLAGKLNLVAPSNSRIIKDTFESHNIVNKYDLILTNPPFGRAGSTAIKHIEKAFRHLEDGGRIVAILPSGAQEKLQGIINGTNEKGKHVYPDIHLRRIINLPGNVFQRAGTSVNTFVAIIDKTESRVEELSPYDELLEHRGDKTLGAFFDSLKQLEDLIPPRPPKSEKKAQEHDNATVYHGRDVDFTWEVLDDGGDKKSYLVKKIGYISNSLFARIHQKSTENKGRYSRRIGGFIFADKLAVRQFLESVGVEDLKDIKYSLSRQHRQVNPIMLDGEVRDEYRSWLENGRYTPDQVSEWYDKALAWVGRQGGPMKAAQEFAEGAAPAGKIGTMAAKLIMNSQEFAGFDLPLRKAVADQYIFQGSEWGREGVARRLASLTLDTLEKAQVFFDRLTAKMEKGDRDRLRDDVEERTGIDIDNLPNDIVNDPAKLDEVLRAALTSSAAMKNKVREYWINAILSGPQTHAANMIGNVANAVYELGPKRLAEVVINLAAKRKTGATIGEFKAMTAAFNWKAAWEKAKIAFDREVLSDAGKVEGPGVAIEGKHGRVIRVPGRLLRAADEFAKAIIAPVEAAAYAYREAKEKNLSEEETRNYIERQIAKADSLANLVGTRRATELTFQEDPGAAVQHLISLREKDGMIGTILQYFLPFIKTPTNLLRQGVRKSPLGAVNLAGETIKLLQGKRQLDNDYIGLAAEQLLAWGAVAMFLGMDDDDDRPILTGTGAGQSLNERSFKAGKIPSYSIRVGDQYISYRRIEPLASGLALIADGMAAYRETSNGKAMTAAIKDMIQGATMIITEKSYLNSLDQLHQFLTDPERGIEQWGTSFLASWIPNVSRQTINTLDNNLRDYRSRARGGDWWKEQFFHAAGKAGFVKVSPKIDYFGREVTKSDAENASPGADLWKLISPVAIKPAADMEKADLLLWNYNRSNPDKAYWPGLPNYTFERGRERYYFAGEDYTDFAAESGKLAHKQINFAIRRGLLNVNKPTDKDIDLIKRIFTRARKETRDKFIAKKRFDRASSE